MTLKDLLIEELQDLYDAEHQLVKALPGMARAASADALRSSLSSLTDVQVVQEGTDSLQAAWTQVQDDWAQFADDARAEHSDDVDGVQADADAARDAVEAAVAGPSAQTLAAAGTAITAFVQNAGALVDEVRSTC